jgi:hypothetical protein
MNLKSDNQNVMQLPKHLNLTVSVHDKFSMCIPVWYTYINLILYCRSRGWVNDFSSSLSWPWWTDLTQYLHENGQWIIPYFACISSLKDEVMTILSLLLTTKNGIVARICFGQRFLNFEDATKVEPWSNSISPRKWTMNHSLFRMYFLPVMTILFINIDNKNWNRR